MKPTTPERASREDGFPERLAGPWYGVYAAIVADVADPEELGRVKVRLTLMSEGGKIRHEGWARMATLSAGKSSGSYFIPDAGDEVLVAFEAGDARAPYVVGALWNAAAPPPASTAADPPNNRRMIRSRRGVTLMLDDTETRERLVLETPSGQRITLTDGDGSIEIADAHGNRIRLEASRISITSSAQVDVSATQVTIAAATVNVNAGTSKFSGVIQTDTLVANSVVAASYSPGAGNIW